MSAEAKMWLEAYTKSGVARFTPAELCVLRVLADRHNAEKGYAWPSMRRIAQESGPISTRYAQQLVRRLAEPLSETVKRAPVIEIKEAFTEDGDNTTNRYFFALMDAEVSAKPDEDDFDFFSPSESAHPPLNNSSPPPELLFTTGVNHSSPKPSIKEIKELTYKNQAKAQEKTRPKIASPKKKTSTSRASEKKAETGATSKGAPKSMRAPRGAQGIASEKLYLEIMAEIKERMSKEAYNSLESSADALTMRRQFITMAGTIASQDSANRAWVSGLLENAKGSDGNLNPLKAPAQFYYSELKKRYDALGGKSLSFKEPVKTEYRPDAVSEALRIAMGL